MTQDSDSAIEAQRNSLLDTLVAGDHAASNEALRILPSLKDEDGELHDWLIAQLVQYLRRMNRDLEQLRVVQSKLEGVLDRITMPPWTIAHFVQLIDSPTGEAAVIASEGKRRVVPLGTEIDAGTLRRGDLVALAQSNGHTTLIQKCPSELASTGITGTLERVVDDRHVLLRIQGEPCVAMTAEGLDVGSLRVGQHIIVDQGSAIAFGALEDPPASPYLFEDVADLGRDKIGGLDAQLDDLLLALTANLLNPEIAAAYGIERRATALLVGPPGCGKTLMVRIALAELQRLSGRRCRFAIVPPGGFESPWVGVTEENIRNCFTALRNAAADGAVAVLLLDEVESIGRKRGATANHHADRSLAALLTELDGFQSSGDVAVIATTNRKDLVDPALLERLSGVEIEVQRPTADGARAIFDVHLPQALRYKTDNGCSGERVRAEMIDTAISLLYAPNADNEVSVVHFRDGTSRRVRARELLSGRVIAQICAGAKRYAYAQEVSGLSSGLDRAAIVRGVSDALARLSTTLTLSNVRSYLTELPHDLDIVRVERVRAAGRASHRYIRAA